MENSSQPSRRRRWLFRAWLALLPLLVACAAEIFVRLTGAGMPDPKPSQLINPVGLPLFDCAPLAGGRSCSTSPWFTYFIGPQKFSLPKPAGTVRVFCLGESAAEGYPFHLPGSFPRLMQVMTGEAGQRRFEFINVAVRGVRSTDVARVCAEIVRYQPDLVIVYLGNNEYVGLEPAAESGPAAGLKYRLRRHLLGLRLYPVLVNLRMKISPPAPAGLDIRAAARDTRARIHPRHWSPDAVLAVSRRFRENLDEIVGLTRKSGATLILSTVAVNLRDFLPFPDAADALTDRCQAPAPGSTTAPSPAALREQALCSATTSWPPDETLPAATAYHEGCCALWAGNPARARDRFNLARDRDRFRMRTTTAQNRIIRETATGEGIVLADVEAAFDARAAWGIPGDDLFLDYVHPTLEGQALIARVMVEELAKRGLLRLDDPLRQMMDRAAQEYLRGLPPRYLSASYITLAGNLANFGMFPRSLRVYRIAIALDPDNASSRQAAAEVEKLMTEKDTATPDPNQ